MSLSEPQRSINIWSKSYSLCLYRAIKKRLPIFKTFILCSIRFRPWKCPIVLCSPNLYRFWLKFYAMLRWIEITSFLCQPNKSTRKVTVKGEPWICEHHPLNFVYRNTFLYHSNRYNYIIVLSVLWLKSLLQHNLLKIYLIIVFNNLASRLQINILNIRFDELVKSPI